MTTKDYLRSVRRYDKMIDIRVEEIERLTTMATNISPKYTEDKVQTSFNNDKIGLLVAEIEDKRQELKGLVRQKGRIIAQIEGMEDYLEYVVLADRYIKGMQFKAIAGDIDRCERYTMQIHDKAIANFGRKYADSIK